VSPEGGTGVGAGAGGQAVPAGGADLHVHSFASDGTDPPARVVERAAAAGLAAMALTDHDTTAGLREAIEAGRRCGIEVVPGIEISTEHEGSEVHLLGWFFRPDDPALGAALDDLLDARRARIDEIVERLNRLGIPLSRDDVLESAAGRSVGRPHVADALVRGGYVASYDDAWEEYLRPGSKAYVERRRLPLAEAIALVRAAGGVSGIAHPTLNLDLPALAGVAGLGIAAVETRHPRVSQDETAALEELCRRYGLVGSAGSDCHGSRRGGPTLGQFTTPRERFEALRGRAGRLNQEP